MQSAIDRRTAMLELLSDRRHETFANLAAEFSVSEKTISRDIQILSVSAPIFTTKGTNGGVYVAEGYRYGNRYLTPKQESLLKKLSATLTGEDADIMQSIFDAFAKPKIQGGT